MDIAISIRAVAAGDRAAFTALYRHLQRPMLAYATGLLAGDREAAEDAVDEAFLDIWKSAGSYAGTGNPQGWVRRIVRNKAIDGLRKRGNKISGEYYDHASAKMADGGASPEDQAVIESEALWLRHNLVLLSTEHRETIILCYFENRSLAEIAQIMECPENTVKTRLFHARKQLNKQYFAAGGCR
jgi:RNA polymerase sigma-70 factor, ECF subfamily